VKGQTAERSIRTCFADSWVSAGRPLKVARSVAGNLASVDVQDFARDER
jgi:hypothetical protein